MPGYWNRPATGQSERKEPSYRQPETIAERQQSGGGDSQQDIINRNNAARIAKIEQDKQAQSIADRIKEEKTDYWVPPTDPYKSPTGGVDYSDKMARAQKAQTLGKALTASGITKAQFERMQAKGTLPPEVAAQLGLAEQKGGLWYEKGTDKRYIPKEHGFSEEDYLGLGEQQFAYDEGVYGGVAGIEAEVNRQKGELNKINDDIIQEEVNKKAQEIFKQNPTIRDEELQTLLDQHISLFKSSGQLKSEMLKNASGNVNLQSLSTLFGGVDTALMNTFGMDPSKGYGSEKAWGATFEGKEGQDIYKSAGDVGYDPTGVYTWNQIQDTPELYNKYLNRGSLWDDPLSGILAPPKQTYVSSGDGGWTDYGWGQGGGGGGGGYGYEEDQPGYKPEQMAGFYTPQANLQQAMINVHQTPTVFKKRGGIVSLLRLN